MNKQLFYTAISALGVKLSTLEIDLMNRVLDPFNKELFEMSKLVDQHEIQKYKQDNLPELKPREEE